jgi:D-beta-D-heptose 7-phosphate kinase / D-beta-D-heptose 1-phosphate adenosyltransferase
LNLVVVGDTLLDRDVHGTAKRLSPDAPVPVFDEGDTLSRPGGAGLAAALAAVDGHHVTLVTALGTDAAAEELRGEISRFGVELVDLGLHGATPVKIRFFAGDHQLMRLDRGAGEAPVGAATAAARAAIGWADAVLVSDYGRGVPAEQGVRTSLSELTGRVPVVWDPHPRGAIPLAGATVATPNEAEAEHFSPATEGAAASALPERGEALRRRWQLHAVCVTRGPRGALLLARDSPPLAVAAPRVQLADTCGAGDRFASRLVGVLAQGRPLADAAHEAVAESASFVAAGGARHALSESREASLRGEADALAFAQRIRATGGTVVATGGCFDLLHAGHLSTLSAARQLGDCLIVCVNSDASVRRLKGSKRPLVPAHDRAAVLAALRWVDAVVVFDEDTPEQALRKLRPHIWVKGGDYQGVCLPEADVLADWGGRAFVLPYVDGRSTTRLIEEAATSA